MIQKIFQCIVISLVLFCSTTSIAAIPLPVDEAFQLSAHVKNSQMISVHFDIRKGYHLYRDQFCFQVISPQNIHLPHIPLPLGQVKNTVLGNLNVFSESFNIDIPLPPMPSKKIILKTCYQGCSDQNFCYPPVMKTLSLNLNTPNEIVSALSADEIPTVSIENTPPTRQDKITTFLHQKSVLFILFSFFGFGLLLAFTPCVLPMLPILSGLIIGHGANMTTKKAFFLSLTYVLGMSITYALAGIFAAAMGYSMQGVFQKPWVIVLFSLFFILLALSLFDVYSFTIPQRWQANITTLSNRQKTGSYLGVFIMGGLATLIVSPCVTPPLVGALAYISQTGNLWLGGSALFVMALGMGVPLLLLGTSQGRLLPPSGAWMNRLKYTLGTVMLAFALWMLGRILPPDTVLGLFGSFLLIISVYLGLFRRSYEGWGHFLRGISFVIAVYGCILMIGFALGNTDLFMPLKNIHQPSSTSPTEKTQKTMTKINSLKGFNEALAQGASQEKVTVLDFYADWCVACHEMERRTFQNPLVINALNQLNFIQADISTQNRDAVNLMKAFQVIAPPTMLFFDTAGNEIPDTRIVGEASAQTLLESIEKTKKTLVTQAILNESSMR